MIDIPINLGCCGAGLVAFGGSDLVAVTSVLLAGPAAAVTEEGSMMTGPPPADVTTFAPPAVTVTVFGGLVLRRAWVGPMAAGRMLPLGATIGGGGGLCCRLAGGCCKMAAMVGTYKIEIKNIFCTET